MQKKSLSSRAFWVIIIGGIVTGMGNGSVFGAAMMCFLGRGNFANWGGWWPLNYYPQTFTGFIDWCMIVFGLAFAGMMWIALKRHGAEESLEISPRPYLPDSRGSGSQPAERAR